MTMKSKNSTGNLGIVSYGHRWTFFPFYFTGVRLFGFFVQLFSFQDGVQTLDGADIDLVVGGHEA